MVDIHCHILPAIDDGVQSMEEALELIGREVEGGTTRFIATPHVYTDQDILNSPQLHDRVAQLQQAVDDAGIAARIVQGAEVFPTVAIGPALDKNLPLTPGGHRKHMLIDLPMSNFPMNFDDILFEVQSRGITPILAHPERTGPFQRDPEKIRTYLEKGIVCQVNAGSVTGKYGQRASEVAMIYLRNRWAQLLASDAHAPRPRPILRRAMNVLSEEIDADYLELLTETSGACVADGLALPPLPQAPPPVKKGFFQGLFGRKGRQ
ncbi:MAG TPA: CpsB/CapC family capsule biosynthesis tyrosine phosphatase [Fimbriimonas sp.]